MICPSSRVTLHPPLPSLPLTPLSLIIFAVILIFLLLQLSYMYVHVQYHISPPLLSPLPLLSCTYSYPSFHFPLLSYPAVLPTIKNMPFRMPQHLSAGVVKVDSVYISPPATPSSSECKSPWNEWMFPCQCVHKYTYNAMYMYMCMSK